jgi:hypothetical protein
MTWEELYPVVNDQAYYAVLRYDPNRKDKIQELLAQSYEKYLRDIQLGKPIVKQNYKCFITQRAKEVDRRSVCKKGLGGTSIRDSLSDYRRRPTSATEVVEYDGWMVSKSFRKNVVEDNLVFKLDFRDWREKFSETEQRVLSLLIEGYNKLKISKKLKIAYHKINQLVIELRSSFINFFEISPQPLRH